MMQSNSTISAGHKLRSMLNDASDAKKEKFEVLILDDNNFDQARIKRICGETGLTISTTIASDIPEFTAALDATIYDVVFVDYGLPKGDGLLAQRMVQEHPKNFSAAVVMISSNMRTDVAVTSLKEGSLDCIEKDAINAEKLREIMIASADLYTEASRRWFGEALAHQREEISRDLTRVIREELSQGMIVDVIDKRVNEALAGQGLTHRQDWQLDQFLQSNEPFQFK